MVAAVALFAAASCAKELPQENLPAGETVVYSASFDQTDTKAVLNESKLKSEWVAGDAITVLDGTKGWEFTTADAGVNAEFTNSEGFGDYRPVLAVYPKGEWTANVAQKTVNANISQWQQAQAGTYYADAALAVAYSENNEFSFKNAHALLKFQVAADNVTHVYFRGNANEAITGATVVTLNADNTVSVVAQETSVECYAWHDDNDKYFHKGETYYVAIAPQVFAEGVTVSIKINEGAEVVAKTTAKKVEAKRSSILDLGTIEYTAPEVPAWQIAGTFNNWQPAAMAKEGDYYVAKNVTGLNFVQKEEGDESANGFKFLDNGNWKGCGNNGKVAASAWEYVWNEGGLNIYVNGAAETDAYDVYLNSIAEGEAKFVVVPAGAAVPEDVPSGNQPGAGEVVVEYWAVIGSMTNNWSSEITMTLDGEWYVAENVALLASDQFKFRANGNWDQGTPNRGAEGSNDGVVIAEGVETSVYQDGKNFSVSTSGLYTLALNLAADKAKVTRTGDIPGSETPEQPENPAPSTPGEQSEWALVGAFSDWKDQSLLTTEVSNVVALKGLAMKAAEGFLVRKPSTDWADKHGAGDVNYLKKNNYIVTVKEGADMCLEADGTYDVYFNTDTKAIYVMEAGVAYTSATEQKVSGSEPVQEEPEVTDKVVYLKPNSNWTQSNARFAAYFWNDSANLWVSMTAVGDGTYKVNLPEGYDYGCNIIFCRMNPGTTANNWNNKWNQTSDLKTPTDGKNLYTVKDGTWDNGGGTWSVK